ncbi:Hypothetical protein R9X50_00487100 [Acrodontium crateriforme]|uniref:Ubiquitin carboxyl-terminal hydrolase n=1 Tax=Acrodontium crateriforme TaxID=150365 RepID=A0AAQ3M6W8_9PEZI|nr:Hypothetical protein R9X50_00487100 [Acrodontium crateriforme]
MPERPLKIATYAAGASLAAITLVYVFGPTYFLDDAAAQSSKASRKKGVVGLVNPANDCFINSVLQALAGLPELRVYLIREIHRRRLDGADMYTDLTAALEEQNERRTARSKPIPEWKLLGLQQGLVTAGLKDVLDALNERPIYKKTISAQTFIQVVETSFRTRISRTQQDAQEFLQLVAERLADEHHAARRVRRRATKVPKAMEGRSSQSGISGTGESLCTKADTDRALDSTHGKAQESANNEMENSTSHVEGVVDEDKNDDDDEPPFPFEGKLESQVECSYCHFKPKPSVSSFVSLTLHVPQDSPSTTLNACFDGMLKIERIDDFTCDRCRLEHALQLNARQLSKTSLSAEERSKREADQAELEISIRDDPEKPPKGVALPDLASAPKRQISRHMRIATFPRILAIHLSRSVWDVHASSSKNMAKVAFPETLPLGGLLDRKTYRLLGVVTHKGGHNSGHYESFRRQARSPPFSTPANMGTEGIYSLRSTPTGSPRVSALSSPSLGAVASRDQGGALETSSRPASPSSPDSDHMLSNTSLDSPVSSSTSSKRSLHSSGGVERHQTPAPTSAPADALPTPGLPRPENKAPNDGSTSSRRMNSVSRPLSLCGPKRGTDRWWRISDEKVKESKTSDVLSMQKEVYLLFYEIVD